ncbi:MAG: L-seryl-tRNA(Sec) selenium transferase [Actinomycetota bacterium]
MTDPRRALPKVDALVDALAADHGSTLSPDVLAWIARRAIDEARTIIESGGYADPEAAARRMASRSATHSPAVINATGVLLHTNLGRAWLHPLAIQAGLRASGSYPVEMDLETGSRGGRGARSALLAAAVTGAEAGLVVNNNAAALLLAATALAGRGEVLASRGELITIGGSFRLPDVLSSAGAFLREVGTTNKTTIEDFRSAITTRTAMILSAHPSNFTIEGFATGPTVTELAVLAREADIPFLFDIGSGLLEPHPSMPDEPDARSVIEAGADLACFSGDKLLGGPQAGIVVGRSELIRVMAKHPSFRALRPGKVVLAQLEETLAIHARGQRRQLHIWTLIDRSEQDVRALANHVRDAAGVGTVMGCVSLIGGGSAPGVELPSWGLALPGEPEDLAARLRSARQPVVCRIESGQVLLDMRSVDPQDTEGLIAAVREATDEAPVGS